MEGWALCQQGWAGFCLFHRVPVLGESRGPALCKCLCAQTACTDCLPPAPRAQAHTCAPGLPDRPSDPCPSEDNWALEAGACQEPLSLNGGPFAC